jgi:membrane-associated protease RseP (regulator of RpoE activity)
MEQRAHWPERSVVQVQTRPLIHVLLLITTILTTTVAGALWEGLDPIRNPALLLRGVPFAGTLVTILLVHESGHYLMCLRHRVSATLPYFLPAPPNIFPLGTFGAFIRIRSRFPDRRALFDIGAAGPWAGFVVALVATAIGLRLSTVLSARPDSMPVELGDSLLTAFLTRVLLHADPSTSTIILHPVAFAGWFGLFVTSINLLPVGQLDGGHVLYAASGRMTRLVPALLLGFLLWLGIHGWPGWFVWAIVLTLLVSLGHPPTENDWRPLGTARFLAAVATLVVFVLTFVAEPFRIVP